MKFLVSFLILMAQATPQEFAVQRQQDALKITKTTVPQTLPGFVSATPKEVNLYGGHTLQQSADQNAMEAPAAQVLKDMVTKRPYFKIDARVIMNGEALSQKAARKTCRESKAKADYTCSRILLNPEIHITPAKYSHYWCTSGNHRPDNPHCGSKKYFATPRKYEEEKVVVSEGGWTSNCGPLEDRARKGLCRKIKTICPKGSETRTVKGQLDGNTVQRQISHPCWRYEDTYACGHSSVDTCEGLRKSSCQQVGSTCIQKAAGECVEWEQSFRCPEGPSPSPVKVAFEAEKIVPPVTASPNQEMTDALAKLSIFEDIQREMRQSPTATSITVFKGDKRHCTTAFGGFKNCCASGKGWGVSMKLTGCSEEESDLANRKGRGQCVDMGSYCALKIPGGGCLKKKRGHCCFPSRLARLLHEQGRKQLGIAWGSAESPQCRGFTPEELARIHFDRLDLKEVFEEMKERAKKVALPAVERNLKDRMDQMTGRAGQ